MTIIPSMKSAWERAALAALYRASEPLGIMCLTFKAIQREAVDLPEHKVRRSVRALARKGLAEYHRALWSDDGRPAGAGYCITKRGQEVTEALGLNE